MTQFLYLLFACLSTVIFIYILTKVVLGSIYSKSFNFWAIVKAVIYATAFLMASIYSFYSLITGKFLF